MSEYVTIKELTDSTAIYQVSLGRPISIAKSVRVYDETFDKSTTHELTRDREYAVDLSDSDTVIRFSSPYYKKFDKVRIEVKHDLSNSFEFKSQTEAMNKNTQMLLVNEKLEQLYRVVHGIHDITVDKTSAALSVINDAIAVELAGIKSELENHLHSAAAEKVDIRNYVQAEIAEHDAATKGEDVDTGPKENPDKPMSDTIKELVAWMHTEAGKWNDNSVLTTEMAAHIRSIDDALSHVAEGDTLDAPLKALIMNYLAKNEYLKDPRTSRLLDAAIIPNMRYVQGDGTHRITKTGLPDAHKPQFWGDEKSIAPLPETLLPTTKEIALSFANSPTGQSGELQIFYNHLRTTLVANHAIVIASYTEDVRNKFVQLDPSSHNWLPFVGAALSLSVRRRIARILGENPSIGINTVMNLSAFGGGFSEIVKPVSINLNYESYWDSATLYNTDGTDKIVNGEAAKQKVTFVGQAGPDQLAYIFSKSVLGKNIISFMKNMSQPGQEELPVNLVTTLGMPIETHDDLDFIEGTYSHLNHMTPGYVSLRNGLKVVPSTLPNSMGNSKLDGTGEVVNSVLQSEVRTQIAGILTRITNNKDDNSYIAEMDPASFSGEMKEVDRVNKDLSVTFANNMKFATTPVMSALQGIGTLFVDKTNAETKAQLDHIFGVLGNWFVTAHAEYEHLIQRLQNPQRFIRKP